MENEIQMTAISDFGNPYQAGKPVQGGSFYGRKDILDKILNNLNRPRDVEPDIFVLHGPKRCGKTSVLLRLRDILSKQSHSYVPIYIDLQGYTSDVFHDESSLLQLITYQMSNELLEQGISAPEPGHDNFGESARIGFERFLFNATQILAGRRLFLMLDEFDKMREWIGEGLLTVDTLGYFRHLTDKKSLTFLFAGTPRLGTFTSEHRGMFHATLKLPVGPMSREDTCRLITDPVKDHYAIPIEAVEKIADVTGCYPFFTQVVCSELFTIL
ncbi:MAG: ATP-binding protein, partial [Acidobacteria bacterium]|nr:ATP-binding protein [Acidobacteriota bacterium]